MWPFNTFVSITHVLLGTIILVLLHDFFAKLYPNGLNNFISLPLSGHLSTQSVLSFYICIEL